MEKEYGVVLKKDNLRNFIIVVDQSGSLWQIERNEKRANYRSERLLQRASIGTVAGLESAKYCSYAQENQKKIISDIVYSPHNLSYNSFIFLSQGLEKILVEARKNRPENNVQLFHAAVETVKFSEICSANDADKLLLLVEEYISKSKIAEYIERMKKLVNARIKNRER